MYDKDDPWNFKANNKDFFQNLYSKLDDPWNFQTCEYEKEKYKQTLDLVCSFRPKTVLEIGCSIGLFTQQLASVVEHVHAIDISLIALEKAKRQCQGLNNIDFIDTDLNDLILPIQFDLIVASEVFYYFDLTEESWQRTVNVLDNLLSRNGRIVCIVHEHHDNEVWDTYFPKFSTINLEKVYRNFSTGKPYTISVFKRELKMI